jgi:hypothetical protein
MAITHSSIKESDLVKNHKRVLEHYMNTKTQWKANQKSRVLSIYDTEIDKTNIRIYLNRDMKTFLVALVTGRLNLITNYEGANPVK